METAFHLNEKTLWRLVNTLFLVFIGLSGGGNLLGISKAGPLHIITALVVILMLALFGNMALRGRLLFLSGIAIILLGVGFATGFETSLSFFQSYFYWLTGRPLWVQEFLTGYELLQTVFLALLCCLLLLAMEKDFRLKITLLAALLVTLLFHLFSEKELSQPSVALILFYIAVIYAEWTQIRWKKEKGRSLPAYMLWVIPFLGIYFLLLLLPSVPEKPYDWQIVKNTYRQLRESFLKFSYNFNGFGGEDYDLTLSGFSERGTLGSESLETDREIMTIQSRNKLATNLYLSGMIYDTFDGRQWLQQNEDSSKARYLDTIETLHAVREYDEDYLGDYLYQADLTINYRYFRSEFLFAPLKTMSLKQSHSNLAFSESGGTLYFDRRKGYGTEYEASFYQLNAGQDIFHEFLNEAGSPEPDEDGFRKLFGELKTRTGAELDMTDLLVYRQSIFENYTEDVILSGDVEEYLREITANAQTKVDRLRAIERELSSFTYTRTPGKLPENVMDGTTFLDYFLLEKKEGYCNYFATAFTLLARAEGFPTRFVQGFCVPVKGNRETKVYSDMAHAWPEVYIEGIGWIPFEPTPGYSGIRYASWTPRNRNTDSVAGLNAPSATPTRENETALSKLTEDAQTLQESAIYPEKNSVGRILRVLILTALSLSVLTIMILLLNSLIISLRYRRMSTSAKFKTEIAGNLRILSLLGGRRKEEETLTEFKNRMLHSVAEEDDLQFLDWYEDFLYGGREITPHLLEETRIQQKALLLKLKQEKKWAYFFHRILTLGR